MNLDDAIRHTPKPRTAQPALPLGHIGSARSFEKIVADGHLMPRECPVFNRNVLYVFYGGLFYRPGLPLTENATEMPVGYLFRAASARHVVRYYPFDTGALSGELYGSWGAKLRPFKRRFAVQARQNSGADIVHALFTTNDRYLRGYPRKLAVSPAPVPLLLRFLNDDLSGAGVDRRQYAIEGHVHRSLPLDLLEWVGFPSRLWLHFDRLCRQIGRRPKHYAYAEERRFSPDQIAHDLEQRARAVLSLTYPGAMMKGNRDVRL